MKTNDKKEETKRRTPELCVKGGCQGHGEANSKRCGQIEAHHPVHQRGEKDAQTRKSTSGGALMHESHLVHNWSRTQKVVALSSAEAVLSAIVKSMTEILCLMNMMKECGTDPKGQILTDSSAANGIVHRQGCGMVKHLDCPQLWVQGIVGEGKVTCTTVVKLNNPADTLTHHWSYEDGRRHSEKLNLLMSQL